MSSRKDNVYPHPRTAEETKERNAALGDKVKDWEPAVCDLMLMSGVTSDCFEHTFAGAKKGEDEYYLSAQTLERLQFTILHLQRMIGEFYNAYYRALDT